MWWDHHRWEESLPLGDGGSGKADLGGVQALMFIELTDHLRCPLNHDEQFLVLLPDRMDGRSVRSGQLGCPVCGRVFRVEDGVFDVGGAPPLGDKGSVLTVEAMAALVGLHGPGGYLVLAGEPAGLAGEVAGQFPGSRSSR